MKEGMHTILSSKDILFAILPPNCVDFLRKTQIVVPFHFLSEGDIHTSWTELIHYFNHS